jgi:exopolyphosphatase/guanosine-5'-triphosphate,3'-diphosphate pyrophosphatase
LKNTQTVSTILDLVESYDSDERHALRVKKLALRLFDELQPLHHMGNTERIWLLAAALLHDIGKAVNPQKHNKLACRIISECRGLPFRRRERKTIGLIARYHRGSLPRDDHKYYRKLDAESRLYVRKLASLLRLADGLDKGHLDLVEYLQCDIRRKRIRLRVISKGALAVGQAIRKADLLEEVFGRRVDIEVETISQPFDTDADIETDTLYAGVC